MNSVAKGLIHTDSKMAIIPVGSGNGLAGILKYRWIIIRQLILF